MKKIFLIAVLTIAIGAIFVGYSKNGEVYNLNLDSNEVAIQMVEKNPIMVKNAEKFGLNYKTAKLQLQMKTSNEFIQHGDVKIIPVEVRGTIKLANKALPFTGSYELPLVNLNGREIFYGPIEIEIKHNGGTEMGMISMIFEPSANNADITITTGEISDTAFIPFGELFLTQEETEQINAILEIGEE